MSEGYFYQATLAWCFQIENDLPDSLFYKEHLTCHRQDADQNSFWASPVYDSLKHFLLYGDFMVCLPSLII